MPRSAFVVASFALAVGGFAQAPPNPAPLLPAHLPGKGLAQHDFMYTGESHDRRIFLVRLHSFTQLLTTVLPFGNRQACWKVANLQAGQLTPQKIGDLTQP